MNSMRRVWVIEMLWVEGWAPASTGLTYREGCEGLRELRTAGSLGTPKDFRLRVYIPRDASDSDCPDSVDRGRDGV